MTASASPSEQARGSARPIPRCWDTITKHAHIPPHAAPRWTSTHEASIVLTHSARASDNQPVVTPPTAHLFWLWIPTPAPLCPTRCPTRNEAFVQPHSPLASRYPKPPAFLGTRHPLIQLSTSRLSGKTRQNSSSALTLPAPHSSVLLLPIPARLGRVQLVTGRVS